jgi:phosphoribosylformylglycinamidine synthase PurS subunit
MTRFRVAIQIVPRRGLLDPQGKAVTDALHSLGFTGVGDVRVGRHLVLDTAAESADEARVLVERMCEQLLANPVTEDFHLAAVEPA